MSDKSYDLGYTPDYLMPVSPTDKKKKDEKPPIHYPSVCFEGNPDFIKRVVASGEDEFEATIKIRVNRINLTTGKSSRQYDDQKPSLYAEIISITPSLPEQKSEKGEEKMDIDAFLKEKKKKNEGAEGETEEPDKDDEED